MSAAAVVPVEHLLDERTTTVELTLEELRLVRKSIGKTMDAEVKKLARLAPGSHHHATVKADFDVIDRVDAELASAMSELVKAA